MACTVCGVWYRGPTRDTTSREAENARRAGSSSNPCLEQNEPTGAHRFVALVEPGDGEVPETTRRHRGIACVCGRPLARTSPQASSAGHLQTLAGSPLCREGR